MEGLSLAQLGVIGPAVTLELRDCLNGSLHLSDHSLVLQQLITQELQDLRLSRGVQGQERFVLERL